MYPWASTVPEDAVRACQMLMRDAFTGRYIMPNLNHFIRQQRDESALA
jgi:hypothetical protein